MIDLHCHILPALDDGALDLDDSLAMARQACSDGVEAVCATPHIRSDHDVRIEELPGRVAALQDELESRGIPLRVLPGGEVAHMAADGLDEARLHAVTLAGAGWVLLEPAPGPLGEELLALVGRLAERRVRTVVAHPERHAGEDFEAQLAALADSGCLLQWTADFLATADPGESDAPVVRCARAGLVHLLGSDAHSSHGGRTMHLSAGFARLAELCPSPWVDWIRSEAPAAIVRGEPASPPWRARAGA